MSHGSQFRPPTELDEPTSARRQDDHHIGGDLDPQQNPGSCVEVNGPLDKPCQHQLILEISVGSWEHIRKSKYIEFSSVSIAILNKFQRTPTPRQSVTAQDTGMAS